MSVVFNWNIQYIICYINLAEAFIQSNAQVRRQGYTVPGASGVKDLTHGPKAEITLLTMGLADQEQPSDHRYSVLTLESHTVPYLQYWLCGTCPINSHAMLLNCRLARASIQTLHSWLFRPWELVALQKGRFPGDFLWCCRVSLVLFVGCDYFT